MHSVRARHPLLVLLLLPPVVAALGCTSASKDNPPSPAPSATTSAEPTPVASTDAAAPPDASAATPAPARVEMPPLPEEEVYPETLEEQRAALLRRMGPLLHITDEQVKAVKTLIDHSTLMGQGNPAVTKYPLTRKECREKRNALGGFESDEPRCEAPFMAPMFDPTIRETAAAAKSCIDRYEFPGIPCEHPVV
jgi:sulfatase modifying factor 1